MTRFTVSQATQPDQIEAVRQLCWDYRSFLLANTDTDSEITETFYPVPKYEALMAQLPRLHARPKGLMLLAHDSTGAPLGCGMTHALDPDTAEIKRVFVSDAARGMGVARRICEDLITQARQDGYRRIVLDTSKSLAAAQQLYATLGFAPCGPYQPIPDSVLPELLFYELPL
jgi:putative acetyltransferase